MGKKLIVLMPLQVRCRPGTDEHDEGDGSYTAYVHVGID